MYYKRLIGTNIYLSPSDKENEKNILIKWFNEDTDIINNNNFSRLLVSEDKLKEIIDKWTDGPYYFSIIAKDDDTFVGTVSLFNITPYSAELGIFIGKDYRNRGYGKEAMNLIKDFAFNFINLKALHINVLGFNEKALSAYQKVGFKECGRWHQINYFNGAYYDTIMMEVLKD